MQAPARNESNRMRQTREFNSSATVVLAPAGLPLHKSCRVVSNNFWNSFNFWSGASAESQLNRSYFTLFATVPYGVVSPLLARTVTCTSSLCLLLLVHNCHLTSPVCVRLSKPDSDSESARLTPAKGGQACVA